MVYQDRLECFDDYFPCRKKKCKLKHVINWLNLFVDFHNKELCQVNRAITYIIHTLLSTFRCTAMTENSI